MSFDVRTGTTQVSALDATLGRIETAQLVRRLDETDLAYFFKHALVQDTAYASLTRHERKRLHSLVGQALEQFFAERAIELAPRLAAHFEQAGDNARALFYFERAAADAAARYTNHEALDFYTRGLAAADELPGTRMDTLYRARAQVYERIGAFDAARADLENSLRIAEERRDAVAEWQSLMDLGFAWLAREYGRAGEYFERALDLARASDDTQRVARTLNRVGNWYLNNEDALRALAYHREALSLFQEAADLQGIAETEDLLGMTSSLGSDFPGAREHFSTALGLFKKLEDTRGYVNCLIVLQLQGASMQGDTVVSLPALTQTEQALAEIVKLTQQIGWRAGESFGLWVIGERFAAIGLYGRGIELIEQGIRVAREIDHRQWITAGMMILGAVHASLLDFETAQMNLESALALAREIGSKHWILMTSGLLASTAAAQNDLTRAANILYRVLPLTAPAQTLAQRQAWAARVELALARHDPLQAHQALDVLMRDALNLTPTTVIPHLWILRARAFLQQDRIDDAQRFLEAAQKETHVTGQLPLEWRALRVLAHSYRIQNRAADAANAQEAAQAIVTRLANSLNDSTLREKFVTRALQMIRGE